MGTGVCRADELLYIINTRGGVWGVPILRLLRWEDMEDTKPTNACSANPHISLSMTERQTVLAKNHCVLPCMAWLLKRSIFKTVFQSRGVVI